MRIGALFLPRRVPRALTLLPTAHRAEPGPGGQGEHPPA